MTHLNRQAIEEMVAGWLSQPGNKWFTVSSFNELTRDCGKLTSFPLVFATTPIKQVVYRGQTFTEATTIGRLLVGVIADSPASNRW